MAKRNRRQRAALRPATQQAFRLSVPQGLWRHGKRAGRAVCPACRKVIKPGEWVRAAPGGAGTVRHVACGGSTAPVKIDKPENRQGTGGRA